MLVKSWYLPVFLFLIVSFSSPECFSGPSFSKPKVVDVEMKVEKEKEKCWGDYTIYGGKKGGTIKKNGPNPIIECKNLEVLMCEIDPEIIFKCGFDNEGKECYGDADFYECKFPRGRPTVMAQEVRYHDSIPSTFNWDNVYTNLIIKTNGENGNDLTYLEGDFSLDKLVLGNGATYQLTVSKSTTIKINSLIAGENTKIILKVISNAKNGDNGKDAGGQPGYGATGYSGYPGMDGEDARSVKVKLELGIVSIPNSAKKLKIVMDGATGACGGNGGCGGIGGGYRCKKFKMGERNYNGGDGGQGGCGGRGGNGGDATLEIDWMKMPFDREEIKKYGISFGSNCLTNNVDIIVNGGKHGVRGKGGSGGPGHPGGEGMSGGRNGMPGNPGVDGRDGCGNCGSISENTTNKIKLGDDKSLVEEANNLIKNIKNLNKAEENIKKTFSKLSSLEINIQKSNMDDALETVITSLNDLKLSLKDDEAYFIDSTIDSLSFLKGNTTNKNKIKSIIEKLKNGQLKIIKIILKVKDSIGKNAYDKISNISDIREKESLLSILKGLL